MLLKAHLRVLLRLSKGTGERLFLFSRFLLFLGCSLSPASLALFIRASTTLKGDISC